ncbi:uncharacterized protein K452DRAFT_249261 [Aplosporella prunicola CBS 121167]|uniref:Uncharacterized protein n=1 Tax=Aplosporella prunicola CBS 121167 TaxID=1176127 RepID=A0A6A6BEC5_9PEZI|nr:uncharacterized protein K452DRAFT_249261 [Aplosporella prunicola CBS 121167]KAF2142510.1 hypothetical protein K452DRAFT_249261 [Aplosporella prunicola CBS 121167]
MLPRKPSIFGRTKTKHSQHHQADAQPARSATPGPTNNGRATTPVPPTIEEAVSPSRRKTGSSRHSFASSVTDFGSNLRRSASLRSGHSAHSHNDDKREPDKPQSNASKAVLSIHNLTRARQKSHDHLARSPPDPHDPKMAGVGPMHPLLASRPPATSASNAPFGQSAPLAAPANIGPLAGGHNPNAIYQHIHDMSSKRISTLDYLRKAHDGRVYWFNTLLFTKTDLSKLSYFSQRSLARRATNYLLLGFSLPAILDRNSQNPHDYLRALNALLIEFETYQSIHPPEGTMPSSLSRGRVAGMFKRATHAASGATKGRRASSATDFGFPDIGSSDTPFNMTGSDNNDLLPGEEYTHLLTPSLPFDPDFFETFSTLCDVLIDCYTKVMNLVNGPEACVPGVGEMFAKADARVRKIIVAGVVREFEDASRAGAKQEVAGVGKVVLGGLM